MRTELCRQRKPFRQRVQLTFWNMKLCWAQQIHRDLWQPSWTQACLLWHYSDVLFPFNGFHQSRSKGSSIVTNMLRAFSPHMSLLKQGWNFDWNRKRWSRSAYSSTIDEKAAKLMHGWRFWERNHQTSLGSLKSVNHAPHYTSPPDLALMD